MKHFARHYGIPGDTGEASSMTKEEVKSENFILMMVKFM